MEHCFQNKYNKQTNIAQYGTIHCYPTYNNSVYQNTNMYNQFGIEIYVRILWP